MKLSKILAALLAAALSACAVAAGNEVVAPDNEMIFLPNGKTVVVPAFRVYVATGYTPSEKNVEFLKSLKEKVSAPRLLAFDATKNNRNMLLCRASFPVYGPNKTPFAALMEAAANMELVSSGLVEPDAPRIQASLDEFDFSSFGSGKWSIHATFSMDGRPPFSVKNTYVYPVSGSAVNGCTDVMAAMPAGIEAFLMKLYSDPGFLAALQSTSN